MIFVIVTIVLLIIIAYIYHKKRLTVKHTPYRIHNELYDLMEDLEMILRKNDIMYIITCGTLLGSVREEKIITWDDDIDIIIFENEDTLEKLKEPLKKIGYELEKKDGIWRFDKYPLLYPYIDIFVGTVENDKLVYKEKSKRRMWPNEYYFMNEIFPIRKYKLGDLILDGPSNPYPYLERAYGEDWKTPKYAKAHGEDKW